MKCVFFCEIIKPYDELSIEIGIFKNVKSDIKQSTNDPQKKVINIDKIIELISKSAITLFLTSLLQPTYVRTFGYFVPII